MAKDKFLDVDLSGLKLEDYCSLVGSEVGTPFVEEVRVALKEASVLVVVPVEVGERLIPWRSNRGTSLTAIPPLVEPGDEMVRSAVEAVVEQPLEGAKEGANLLSEVVGES
ncbi:hypothetical protein CJ030_MR8G009053 [Morella rubra]|uniref:Uncharacterized protein n=1 Tax=Morella rubra TaxID=262757 RepID=A0A6A1UV42_9ROSI|nr:hypothetical protein CJ030_MR8G009053 [Morella rubra]